MCVLFIYLHRFFFAPHGVKCSMVPAARRIDIAVRQENLLIFFCQRQNNVVKGGNSNWACSTFFPPAFHEISLVYVVYAIA